jgi:hypothetical protein
LHGEDGSGNLGHAEGKLDVTSELSSDTWQSFVAPAGFPALFNPSVAPNPVDHSLVVFGGCLQAICGVGTNATWTESSGVWTEIHPSLSPAPREEAQMAWDPADGYVLLFGGTGCRDPPACDQNGPLNDTWAFKDGAWNPVISSGPAPPPTDQGGLAYDPSDRLMVLFGGYGCASPCATWTYSGGTWTEPNLTTQPPARYGEGFAEDDSDHGALLYGGVASSGSYLADTWLFWDGAWHPEPTSLAPALREDPAMAWDPGLGAVVLFGGDYITTGSLTGSPSTFYNDTWEFQNGTWSEWGGSITPGPLWEAGVAEDPTTGVLMLVGGCESTNCPSAIPWGFGPPHAVTVSSETGTCANFTLAGTPLSSGGASELQNGTYPLHIGACSGFEIANLSASSLLVLNATAENVSQWTGTVLVHGVGTLLVNLTHAASNSRPTGLAAISILGLTFLELLLIVVALAAVLGIFVALQLISRRRARPREKGGAGPKAGGTPPAPPGAGLPPANP